MFKTTPIYNIGVFIYSSRGGFYRRLDIFIEIFLLRVRQHSDDLYIPPVYLLYKKPTPVARFFPITPVY